MARIGFLLNGAHDMRPSQTTAMLVARAAARGHETVVFGVGDVAFDGARVVARAYTVPTPDAVDIPGIGRTLAALKAVEPRPLALDTLDGVLVRTSPGRDPARAEVHRVALDLLRMVDAEVLNRPDGLGKASSKLYLSHLPPETRPETVIGGADVLRGYVLGRRERSVLKPLVGTRGQDVFLVDPNQRGNLNQIIDVLTRNGPAMAQSFVPEAVKGDTRVLLLDGEPLVVDGHAAAVRRIPGAEDFRSNVHVGATPAPGELTPAAERVAAAIGPILRRDGLWLVGMDLIGDVIVELNVFSTGGLMDAEANTGADFTGRVLDAFEQRMAGRGERAR